MFGNSIKGMDLVNLMGYPPSHGLSLFRIIVTNEGLRTSSPSGKKKIKILVTITGKGDRPR